jgi:phage terminase large subunit-like protein
MASRRKRTAAPEPTRAERNIKWVQDYCVVPEGKDIGKPVVLREWQKADLRKIYDNPSGTRTAIISFGKKNGKTSLAACLLLLHLCGPEALPNTQLPSTATTREQAAVLFNLAAKMVRMSPDLNSNLVIRDTAKQIFCPDLGTLYKALSADASSAHGQSPFFAIHDELGQVRGPVSELYNAIENAMGAHDAPMSVIISTQAPTDADLLSILIDDGLTGRDPSVVVSLYTADPEMDPFSDEAIKQANPAVGDFLNFKEVRKQAENAKALPSQESLYRNYTLNQRVDRTTPFISKSVWQSCGEDITKDWKDYPVYAGLDLSSTSDLTAFTPIAQINGAWETKPQFWLPGVGLREKARADRTPYDLWAEQGFIQTPDARSIEYEYVAEWLRGFVDSHNVRKIAFDRWGMKYLRPWLKEAGFTEEQVGEGEPEKAMFVEFGQGFQSMSPALRDLESILLNGKLRHGNNPVLTMCAANAIVTSDPAGGRKLNKAKAAGRIDGMVALTMAFGIAPLEIERPLEISAMVG